MDPKCSERQPMSRFHDDRTAATRIRGTGPTPPPIPHHQTGRDDTRNDDEGDDSP